MDSLTGSSDRISKQTETPSPEGGRKNLIQRLLHRNGSAGTELGGSRNSTASAPKHSVIERLEGFFVQDLPAEMGAFPAPPEKPLEEPASHNADQEALGTMSDAKVQPNSNGPDANEENGGGVSSTYTAVRTIRTTAKEAIARSQEAYQEIEAKLKGWTQELEKSREQLSEAEATSAVKLRELRTQATLDVAVQLQKECQPVLEQSTEQLRQRSEAAVASLSSAAETAAASLRELQEAIARSLAAEADRAFQGAQERSSEQLQKQSEAVLGESRQQVQKESQAAFAGLQQQLNERSEAVVAGLQGRLAAEKQRFADEAGAELEKLRAASAPLVEEARKQLAVSVQPTLDGLTKAGMEKARAELETLREKFVNESQSQVVTTFRASLDLLTKGVAKDLVERASAELAGARQTAVQEMRAQLDKMSRETTESLQARAMEAIESAASLHVSNQLLVQKAHAQVAEVARDSFSGLLEAEIKSAIERGRQELGNMVDGFLAKAVPQIQVELEKLVSRHMESIRAKPEPQSVARPAPQIAPVQNPQERAPAPLAAPSQNVPERPPAPTPSPRFSVSAIEPAPSLAQRFSAPQIDPMAITTSQLARAKMVEPPRVASAPPPLSQPPGRTLDFRLAESALKQRRIETRDLTAGIASGLKLGLALGAIALVIFGIYFFLSPVVRLKANPPAAFFDADPSWTAGQQAREDQLARLYWQAALTQIQPRYAFGTTLPANAPDDFALAGAAPSGAVANTDAAARARYWEKLRTVWDQPASWERISKWDPESMRVTWKNIVSKVGGLFSSSNASPTAP